MPAQQAGRSRWWIAGVATSFVLFALLIWWTRFLGPEWMGFNLDDEDRVVDLLSGSAATRAGLATGDRLLSWDGEPIAGGRWFADLAVGRPYSLGVERDRTRLTLELILGRRSLAEWARREMLEVLVRLLVGSLNVALALVLAWHRPRDLVALVGAGFLAVTGTTLMMMSPLLPYGSVHLLRQLPLPLIFLLLLPPILASSTAPELMLSFTFLFPQRLFRSPWVWLLLWSPALFRLPAVALRTADRVVPELALPQISLSAGALAVFWDLRLAYTAACPFVLLWGYRHVKDRNQRRRLRVVVAGLALSLLPLVPAMLAIFTPTWLQGPAAFWNHSPLPVLASLLYGVGPIAMAFAILRHRVFDVGVIVRQGIQYATARGLLLSLVPICAALFVADLAFHGDQTLGQIVGERGVLYLGLGAAGFVLHARQKVWLGSLDRLFFRERYDAQRLLRGVVEEVRQAHRFEMAAPQVAAQIAAALHPELVALLMRPPGQAQFQPAAVIASDTAGDPLPALAAESKLLAVLRLLGKPVEISPSGSGWLQSQLPPGEADLLRQTRLEWLFPIALVPGTTEALLVLGRKLSEEPYSQEDQDLLAAITTSLALLLERPRTGAEATSTGMRTTPVEADTLLAGRYRLGQMLGRGGMGSVFEAVDTTLDRRVAVKLMRPELLQDPAAVARFQREARAAASFTHPNVVTVHDFGVAVDRQAYLVMERLEGETLREELRRQGKLAPPRVVEVLRAVAAAVDAAHERRLVHRDLKPENVFLARLGKLEVPKVLDFGIAKSLTEPAGQAPVGGTAPGLLLGTPPYMSPGQLQGGEPAPAWDLWSLAVLTYEALTGTYPFPPLTTGEGWRAVVSGQVATTAPQLGEAAAAWDAFFRRALSGDPAQRPDSAGRLAEMAALASANTPTMGLAAMSGQATS